MVIPLPYLSLIDDSFSGHFSRLSETLVFKMLVANLKLLTSNPFTCLHMTSIRKTETNIHTIMTSVAVLHNWKVKENRENKGALRFALFTDLQ